MAKGGTILYHFVDTCHDIDLNKKFNAVHYVPFNKTTANHVNALDVCQSSDVD